MTSRTGKPMTREEFAKLTNGKLSLADLDWLMIAQQGRPGPTWQWMYDKAVELGLLADGKTASELDGFE